MKHPFPLLSPLRLFALLGLLFSSSVLFAAGSITNLGRLNNGTRTTVFNMNSNGTVVVGGANDGAAGNTLTAYYWTESTGIVSLGKLNGGNFSRANDITPDGIIIVGQANNGAAANMPTAFRWTQATGFVSLGFLNGGNSGSAEAITPDGTVIVGSANDGANANTQTAFRWTQATGMVGLVMLNGGNGSTAAGVTTNGNVIVGSANDGANLNRTTAVRWTQPTVIESLIMLNGGNSSTAFNTNADGSVIVGFANDGTNLNRTTAVFWTQPTVIQSLGMLNGGTSSIAFNTNAAGTVIVGTANDGAFGNAARGFRWTKATGLQKVDDWLRANGVSLPFDVTSGAFAVSDDGLIVTGTLGTTDAYIARVTPDTPSTSGLISLANVSQSISSVGNPIPDFTIEAMNMLMHGSHGYPLSGLIPANRDNNVWVAGDWGKFTHQAKSGLAEVGISHRLCSWLQDSIGVGLTRGSQDLDLGGHARSEGAYALAEVMAHYRCLFATLSAFYHWGDIDIRRGYLNAGLPDSSRGKPRTETLGFRFRLDWKDMLECDRLSVSPYGEVSTIEARIKAYTESSGSFPARFNARDPNATDARVGLRAYFQAACNTRLFATAEGVFNLKQNNPSTGGQLIGLFAFDLSGTPLPRRWVRGGLGLEQKIGTGVASIAVNATSKGRDARYWLAANYYLSF